MRTKVRRPGIADVTVTHGGTAMTKLDENTATDGGYYYDSAEGKLYIYSSTYSTFNVKWVEPEVEVTASEKTYTMTLTEFRGNWNAGRIAAGAEAKLLKDVDISALSWEPIGDKTHPFIGTFDGNGKTISGMTNGDYHGESTPNGTTAHIGETYGFFAFTAGTVVIKDLTLDKISVDYENAKVCGGLIGNTNVGSSPYKGTDSLTITDVNVSGNIKGYDKAAGLIGYLYDAKAVDIENCTVAGSLSLTNYGSTKGYRAGGLFGFISCSEGATGLVKDCTVSATLSKGDSTSEKLWIGAITSGYNSEIDMDIVNFKFTGEAITDHNLIPTLKHDKFSGHGDRFNEAVDVLGDGGLPLIGYYGKFEMSYYRESYNGNVPPATEVIEDLKRAYHLNTAAAADGSYTFKMHAAIFTVGQTNPGDSITIDIADDLAASRYIKISTGEMARH